MFKKLNKRGSVLLMVVGLLVILGTLGGTFLLVSNLDARQSRLLAGRGKAELVASGAVGKVLRALSEDLHFAPGKSTAPFTAPDTTYKDYIDFSGVDRYLFDDGNPSNVFGTSQTKVSTEFAHDDSDSDKDDDSYLVPTGEFSDDGEEYYVAIKVTDMSSLLSLNTGGENYVKGTTDTTKILKSPALINLKGLISNYANIHTSRCGGTSKPLTDYDRQCGRQLLSPEKTAPYRPFPISDEVFLRWRGEGEKAKFGRVFEVLGKSADKEMLTTISCSRSLMRNPIGDRPSRFDLSKTTSFIKTAEHPVDPRKVFYEQTVLLAGSSDGQGGGPTPGTEKVLDNSAGGFSVGSRLWKKTSGNNISNAYNGNAHRYSGVHHKAWWVFKDLPDATYAVWATWGVSSKLPGAPEVLYEAFLGGTLVPGTTASYSGGTRLGGAVANQSGLPNGEQFEGHKWQKIGDYKVEGQLVVQLTKIQTDSTGTQYAFADAIRIKGTKLELGGGSQPAAHLMVNTWAAVTELDPNPDSTPNAFAFKVNPPKDESYTVFGVTQQPFITEAFATHTTRIMNPDGTFVEDSWKWGAAIELMNFSSKPIRLKHYRLVFGRHGTPKAIPGNPTIPAATAANGGRLVLYNFDTGNGGPMSAVFTGGKGSGEWVKVPDLNFDNVDSQKEGGSKQRTIRLMRRATEKGAGGGKEYFIPVDHVIADPSGDLPYELIPTDEVKTSILNPGVIVWANCRRDDDMNRHRYSVAKYWNKRTIDKPAAHKLGQDNMVSPAGSFPLPEATLKQGFRIKVRRGLLDGPGELSYLYLAGPIIYDGDPSKTNDLPGMLAQEYATDESRGRANSYAKNTSQADFTSSPWNAYPRSRGGKKLAWPLLLSEVVETVPMDVDRVDSPDRVYGRINVNTATKKVLEALPWPNGVSPSKAAGQIIEYRESKGGFVTPGEVTLAMEELVQNSEESLDFNRDAVYAAISGCITVSSDLFAMTIRVQLGKKTKPEHSWHYVAVVDRGCAVTAIHKPAVLLFTQVK